MSAMLVVVTRKMLVERIVLGIIFTLGPGIWRAVCAAEGSAKLMEARRSLAMSLAGWQADRTLHPASKHRYCEACLTRALRITKGKYDADFRKPSPIQAMFREMPSNREGGAALALHLAWLENGWDSSGIYVVDGDGQPVGECRWSAWSDKEEKLGAGTLLREWAFFIAFGKQRAVQHEHVQVDKVELNLPPDVFRKNRVLKVGIISKDGSRSEPLDAYIEEAVRGHIEPGLYNARGQFVETLAELDNARMRDPHNEQLWSGLNRYTEQCLTRALEMMEGKRDAAFCRPLAICAAFRKDHLPGGGASLALHVRWLEEGQNSAGIYVVNGHNEAVGEYRWRDRAEDDTGGKAATLLRGCAIPITVEREHTQQHRDGKVENAVMHLPADVFCKHRLLKVGIIAKDGSRGEPQEAWVEKAVAEFTVSEDKGRPRLNACEKDRACGNRKALGDAQSWRLPIEGDQNIGESWNFPQEFTNSIGMKFRLISAGDFVMGSPKEERAQCIEERHESLGWTEEQDRLVPWGETPHRVRITKPYYLGVYEVTQRQYKAVMKDNPSWFSAGGGGREEVSGGDTGRFPVESVYWWDAVTFCKKLSAMELRSYRLPTEAEWEYACRAGTETAFSFGTELNGSQANCDGRHPYGTATRSPVLNRTTDIGSYLANPWGLHDMHGNVWEWCADWYADDYDKNWPMDDPSGPSTPGYLRVIRGGCWCSHAISCRSGSRLGFGPGVRWPGMFGFRVVLEVPPGEEESNTEVETRTQLE